MTKRLKLRAAMSLLLVLFSMPSAWAEKQYISGTSGPMWEYDSSTQTLTISGEGDMPDFNISNISEENPWWNYNYSIEKIVIGQGITHIGDWAFYLSPIQSIDFPNSVTSIGKGSFYNSCLTSLTIPNSITSIDDMAFCMCAQLSSTLYIPPTVTYFGESVFDGCSLISATVPKNCGGNYGKTLTIYGSGDMLDNVRFSAETIVIETGITSIGNYAFSGCESLKSITIPIGITSIGNYAFENCRLESITIPEGVTTIGSYAFSEDEYLKSISLPSSVKSIGKKAFNRCRSMTSIEMGDGLREIGDDAFDMCLRIKRLNIPAGVTSIGAYAFNNCDSLESISIPSAVTFIGRGILTDCRKLESIVVDAENTVYDSRNNCNAIIEKNTNKLIAGCHKTIIPNNVTTIGASAFGGYTNLKSIVIPSSVTTIESTAFDRVCRITDIYCYASPSSFNWATGDVAFMSEKKTVCHVTDKKAWSEKFPSLNVTFVGDLENINKLNSTLDGTTVTLHVQEGEATAMTGELVIPETYHDGANSYTVTALSADAFKGCTDLTAVSIPSTVTSIGSGAFSGCAGLSSFTIPSGVTEINASTFAGCSSLASISLPTNISAIGNNAFDGCSSLSSITLPTGLTSIAKEAFKGTGLTGVNIPSSVTTIGEAAFAGCTALAAASLPSSLTSIAKGAFKGTGLTTIEIPYSVKSVGESSFEGCSGLKSVTLPTDLAMIAKNTFLNCTSMTTVNIPVAVTKIEEGAFKNCDKLVAVTLPSGLVELGMSVFENSGLQSITLPPEVTAIAQKAFYSCRNLVSATLYAPQLTTYADNAFDDNAANRKISVLSDYVDTYKSNWSKYSNDIVPISLTLNDNPKNTAEKWCTYYNAVTNVTVPAGVTIYKAQLDQANSKVMLSEVGGSIIAKGNAVMLKGSTSSINLSSAASAGSGSYANNDLKGGTTTSGYVAYTLAGINGVMGFYQYTGESLDPNKAHLEVAAAGARSFIGFDSGTSTDVKLQTEADDSDQEWYTIDGRKLKGQPTQKGIYVKNGKKHVVK